jgi:hypothetical protein
MLCTKFLRRRESDQRVAQLKKNARARMFFCRPGVEIMGCFNSKDDAQESAPGAAKVGAPAPAPSRCSRDNADAHKGSTIAR